MENLDNIGVRLGPLLSAVEILLALENTGIATYEVAQNLRLSNNLGQQWL